MIKDSELAHLVQVERPKVFINHMSLMSKTAAFTGMRALRNLVTDSMAIDMGSSATIIFVRDRGVVVDEPSLVAVNTMTGEVVAIGLEAQQMYGREARDVTVIAPLLDGVVADFERTKQMLAHFVRQARSGVSHFSRRALMSVPSGVTQVEERALLNAAEQAGIGRICMIEDGFAAAMGAGIKLDDARASAVVDVGGATTSVAVVANGSIVHARSERFGSWAINDAIIDHVRRHRGLAIGEQTAEHVKLELASANPPTDLAREVLIKGRDVLTSGPGAIEISAGEIYPVAHEVVRKIVEFISTTLTELPPEVAGDIYDRGIVLTGGGAQLSDLENYLREKTRLPVQLVDDPRFAIVRGLAQMFDEPLQLRRIMKCKAPFIDVYRDLSLET